MTSLIQKKICLLGDFAVGKTSLIQRFVHNIFDLQYLSTLGVHISRKDVPLPEMDTLVRLLVWDLAGKEKCDDVRNGYLKGASGVIVVGDLSRLETFKCVEDFSRMITKTRLIPACVIVGNKVDLFDDRLSVTDDVNGIATELNLPCTITSAKTGEGVEATFLLLAKTICREVD
jgi:small GTP-binding protein